MRIKKNKQKYIKLVYNNYIIILKIGIITIIIIYIIILHIIVNAKLKNLNEFLYNEADKMNLIIPIIAKDFYKISYKCDFYWK